MPASIAACVICPAFYQRHLQKHFVKIGSPFAASGWEQYVKFARFAGSFLLRQILYHRFLQVCFSEA
jgi:hypothetical protein